MESEVLTYAAGTKRFSRAAVMKQKARIDGKQF